MPTVWLCRRKFKKREQEIDELVMEKLKNEENQNANQRSVCDSETKKDLCCQGARARAAA